MSQFASSKIKERLEEFRASISEDLDRCVHFWLSHSVDEQFGGFFTCLDANGSVYDTTKYSWLLSRQVWMFARLYQEVPRFHRPDILDLAKKGADFVMQNVKTTDNKCYFSLTKDGKPIKIQRQIFSECFYVMAMSEMYRVLQKDIYKSEAAAVMKHILRCVRVDNSSLGLPLAPPTPTSSLAVPMMLLCLVDQLETAATSTGDVGDTWLPGVDMAELGQWCVQEVMKHVHRGGTVVLETVGAPGGGQLEGSQGRIMNPGHAIEAGWFLLQRATKTGDVTLQDTAVKSFISEAFSRGWDEDNGGILYFIDVDGKPPLQLEWDMKLWWPHNEAMIAFLMAYRHTKDHQFLHRFQQVFDYSYKHFVDKDKGEWYGYLNREGHVKIHAKGGPWKGCFHVPRALMMCEKLLEEIIKDQ